jgi:hypothetical protein
MGDEDFCRRIKRSAEEENQAGLKGMEHGRESWRFRSQVKAQRATASLAHAWRSGRSSAGH